MSQQRRTVQIDARGHRSFGAESSATSINVAPPVLIDKVPVQQILGTFSGTVPVTIPALTADAAADTTFTCSLTTFPRSFTISAAGTGIVLATVALQATSDTTTLICTPVVSLTFGTGLPQMAGSGTWTLRPRVAYQGAQVNVTFRAFSLSSVPAQTVSFLIQAQLIGIPNS